MISGVKTLKLKRIDDERGWLVEILRSDWETYQKFGQVYLTTAFPDVVKAWHMHKRQTDHLTCIKGEVKLVLYDGRENSPTHREVDEFTLEERKPTMIVIPNGIWHGFKTLSSESAFIINVPTELYNYENPDEERLPPNTKKIPYDWKLKPGLKHG